MAKWKSRVGQLALALVATLISGCPISVITAPQLNATPGATGFNAEQTSRDIALSNTGGGTLTWTAQEVTRASADAPWVAADVSWLALNTTSGTLTTDLNIITLTADRTGLSSGLITNTGIQIESNGGTITVPISLTVEAQLQVTPLTHILSSADTSAAFTVVNSGATPLSWTITYLTNADNPASGAAFPTGFSVSPASGNNQALASSSVTVTFPAGSENFALLVNSDSGQEVVRFSVGSPLTGLTVSPSTLTLSIASGGDDTQEQPASTLRIENTGTLPISWTLDLVDRIDPGATPPLTADPILGTTQVNGVSEVAVRISNPDTVVQGDGLYELVVRVGDSFEVIPIIVDVLPLPEITLALPPETEFLQPPVVETNLLDYGEDLVQEQFFVVNTGSRDSQLFFEISYDEQGQDDALIADISPIREDTTGSDRDFFLFDQQVYTDGVPVVVTINRNNLEENLETRIITVRAFESSDYVSQLTAVAEKTIEIRVAKPPFTITGALNRARAPSMLRFVFSNRDELGQVVPLQTEADRARIAYEIFENEIPLDLNETNQFLDFDYRGNVVLVLDFTGSMYNAGTTGTNPLAPGEAVELMREATMDFIDDLPPNFNLQLMYHTDRIPEDRIIQRFTNDRTQLKDALARFTVAPALFGDSDIVETLEMAMASLAAEDPSGTLPFDDADVRAVVFITDGEETVAGNGVTGIESMAEETRTRLFPVAYSPNGDAVRLADLIVAADTSGGHLYTAGSVDNLSLAFGTRKSMEVVATTSDVPNTAAFVIRNIGTSTFAFTITATSDVPWLEAISLPEGNVNGAANQQIALTLNQTGIAPDTPLEASVSVVASNGDQAEVLVQFVSSNGSDVSNIETTVRDETGTIWEELNNQSVLTYITPKETDFQYLLSGAYQLPDETIIEGPFQRNAVFVLGDARIGQVSLHSAGIIEDLTTLDPAQRYRAEVFVYADYIPRNITEFFFRFIVEAASDLNPADQALLDNAVMTVTRAEDGLLDNASSGGTATWRLIPGPDGRFDVLTDSNNYLPVGGFGNLLKITFTNLSDYVSAFGDGARQPEFFVSMRMDNSFYISPQTEGQPSSTKFFIYPAGVANDGRALSVALGDADLAGPAQFAEHLSVIPGFDPESEEALDSDLDTIPNFNDPFPMDDELPASRVIPNPIDVSGDEDTFVLTISNNLLDSFSWNVSTDNLPAWIPAAGIRYGENGNSTTQLLSTLAPGESESVQFSVDRTGLTPGTAITESIEFTITNSEFAFILPEFVSVTLEINP